ncbi:folate/biopterin family MFS transporter [Lyngbya confervoides]|uniref:Folate/biopterin family MFS transporter n=1 Tax=Lyngbya confervoides BDU141951 TaxID=1574623 RepID=A0ABD4T8K8_9CYAN|nr:folate/biopterin family MFS transporter [Lyngbya confervoides]MCM1984657.1 folate/biopterin family MFS transporter [Lyngbya confervoides BDU141951]
MFVSAVVTEQLKAYCKKSLLFGQEPSPELFAILLVYFVQGILGLSRLAVSFFLKDDLGLTPAQVSALMGIATVPWVIKPLYGFLSDTLPIAGYRRRSYLLLAGLLGSLAWLYLALFTHHAWEATLAIAGSSLAIAISDVIVDSVVVQRIQAQPQGSAGELQSLCWSATALGGLITAYLGGSLLEIWSQRTLFAITATFPLLVALAALLIQEPKVLHRLEAAHPREQMRRLRAALTQKSILLPVAFLFLWQATPSSESAFFFFTTNDLGFNPEFLGRVRLVTSFASLLGIWVFQRFLKTVAVRVIFFWSTLLATGLGMTTLLLVTHANRELGIDDRWFSLGDSLILTVMGQIAFMPVLVLAARLCPKGIEATMFATLMALSNFAGVLSHESGALLMHGLGVTETNFDRLWLLVLITNLTTLLPLPLLRWLPEQVDSHDLPSPGEATPQDSAVAPALPEQSLLLELSSDS